MGNPRFRRWVCDACGYIYHEADGDPDSGLAPGTRFEDIPDDWQCPLCGLTKSDLRLLPDTAATVPRARPRSTRHTGGRCRGGDDYVVIVGAGIGGWSAAEAIRRRDPQRPILLVTACEGLSYPKPALSTALADGRQADDLAEQEASERAAGLEIAVRTETRVIKIDTHRKRLTTAKGGIQYGSLILALGAHQRELPITGDASGEVLRVNDLTGYRKLRARLDSGVRHVAILGAGLIGCEFAEDLSSVGYRVSVVDPTDHPLASLLPSNLANELRQRLQHKGVQWHFHATVDAVEHNEGRLRATLSSGEAITTDLVLSAAGLVANTALAENAGLAIDKGISTDRFMQTSIPDIYAIGDCAAIEGRMFAYIEPIRRQAETIAAHLQGAHEPFVPQPPLVRVKTPSFPLSICPPSIGECATAVPYPGDEQGRIDYRCGDRIVGFVLSGDQSNRGNRLYHELFH